MAKILGLNKDSRSLKESIAGADVFVGVSLGGLLKKEMVQAMNKDSIIFAMANPDPEIYPEEALEAGASIVGTGRSDFPNQINNALVFPGIFRGLLDSGRNRISQEMKIKVAEAIANIVKKPHKKRILPAVLDKRVVSAISEAVKGG
jgi:malate dehydrogenase (oxaloacetate-decarboxylating)